MHLKIKHFNFDETIEQDINKIHLLFLSRRMARSIVFNNWLCFWLALAGEFDNYVLIFKNTTPQLLKE